MLSLTLFSLPFYQYDGGVQYLRDDTLHPWWNSIFTGTQSWFSPRCFGNTKHNDLQGVSIVETWRYSG